MNTYMLILARRGESQIVHTSTDLKELSKMEDSLRKACRRFDPHGTELDCYIARSRSEEEVNKLRIMTALYNSLTDDEKHDYIAVDGRTYVRKIWEYNHPNGK